MTFPASPAVDDIHQEGGQSFRWTGNAWRIEPVGAKFRQTITGRFYLYSALTWVTSFDDNYGSGYHQWNEQGGTGADPIVEWEHQGMLIPPDTRINNVDMMIRANTTQITDIELHLIKVSPSTAGRWEGVGVDNDAEVVSDVLYRDMFFNPANGGLAFTGNMADRHLRRLDLSGVTAATYSDFGEFRLYIRPVGTHTNTQYGQATILIETQEV